MTPTAVKKLKKKKFDILKTYDSEIIISIDKVFWDKIYSEYIEDQEMNTNKKNLQEKYEDSLKSGFGLEI